jgi:hypothetical protein
MDAAVSDSAARNFVTTTPEDRFNMRKLGRDVKVSPPEKPPHRPLPTA